MRDDAIMCGICGVLNFHQTDEVCKAQMTTMRDSMVHRGPDEGGIFHQNNVCFGTRRLRIIDLEGGCQPMSNEDGSMWIAFNGEIYNYIELRRELLDRGHKFKSRSDTEVILHLYEEEGQECVAHLNGMFAFALWDGRARELFLARDPFGIKPLYYAVAGRGLVFASEVKAILTYLDARAELNPASLADYVVFQYLHGPNTLFKGITRLLPGHWMRVKGTSVEVKKYWDVEIAPDFGRSEESFCEELHGLISDSVAVQLRSDVPLGCHLSGGIDTATIVGLAAKHLGSRIKTFTVCFSEGGIYDDSDHANISAQHNGTEHFQLQLGWRDFVDCFDRLMYVMDEPMAGEGAVAHYYLSKLAGENVKVALGGQGADEMFGGYIRYLVLYLERLLLKESGHPSPGVSLGLRDILEGLPQLKNYVPMLRKFFSDGAFGDLDRSYYRLIRKCKDIHDIFSRDFLDSLGDYDPFDAFQKEFNQQKEAELLDRILYYEIKNWLPALLHVEDRTSMAWSLESRVPFLDVRIAQLAFAIPTSVKFKGGRIKHIQREAAQGLLDPRILNRPAKIGFPVPLHLWHETGFGDMVRDYAERLASRGIFQRSALEALREGRTQFSRQLWGMLCLEGWFRQFVDK